MELSQIEFDRNVMVMGASGTGKTHLIGTLCQLLPTLVITSDKNGLETLLNMNASPQNIVLIEDWRRCWDYLQNIEKSLRQCLALAIDDFGSVQTAAKRKIELMPANWKEERIPLLEFTIEARRRLLLGERQMQLRQWGKLWTAIESFLIEILSLPFKVRLLTTLETTVNDPRTGDEVIVPALVGQARTSIPAKFSLVAEAFVSEIDSQRLFCLSSEPHPRVETKDRYAGRVWINPTAKRLLQHMSKDKQEEVESEIERRVGFSFAPKERVQE